MNVHFGWILSAAGVRKGGKKYWGGVDKLWKWCIVIILRLGGGGAVLGIGSSSVVVIGAGKKMGKKLKNHLTNINSMLS